MNSFISFLICNSALPLLIRELFQRHRITILLYHKVDPMIFEGHLKILESRYNIISLRDLIEWMKNNGQSEIPKMAVVITFDDGLKELFELLPIIKKTNIRPTVFLLSGIVGRKRHLWDHHVFDMTELQKLKTLPDDFRIDFLKIAGFSDQMEFDSRTTLSDEEISEMKECVDFQSHTVSHVSLPFCSDEKAWREISESKAALEKKYGLDIYALAYPHGNYCGRDMRFAREAGYTCALTVDPGFNTKNTNDYGLKRLPIHGTEGKYELMLKACGLWAFFRKLIIKRRHGFKRVLR